MVQCMSTPNSTRFQTRGKGRLDIQGRVYASIDKGSGPGGKGLLSDPLGHSRSSREDLLGERWLASSFEQLFELMSVH